MPDKIKALGINVKSSDERLYFDSGCSDPKSPFEVAEKPWRWTPIVLKMFRDMELQDFADRIIKRCKNLKKTLRNKI